MAAFGACDSCAAACVAPIAFQKFVRPEVHEADGVNAAKHRAVRRQPPAIYKLLVQMDHVGSRHSWYGRTS